MKIRFHSVCDEFEPLTDDERKRLRASLKKHGCKQPVLIWKDSAGIGWVMDGKHRVTLCDELEITYPVTLFPGTEEEAKTLARSLNEDRRHRPIPARAFAAAREANAPEGRRPTTSQDVVTEGKAAAKHDVSVPSVQRAKTVLEHGTPALQKAAEKGDVPLKEAAALAKEPPKVQEKVVSEIKKHSANGKPKKKKRSSVDRKTRTTGNTLHNKRLGLKALGALLRVLDYFGIRKKYQATFGELYKELSSMEI